jgi:DNA polymerase-4
MQPIIAHIDMNSYFARCEQQDNPAWRGKPVGVCEHLGGIIIAASVEAKRWGIKTGTPVWEARKLYPKIILTKTNPSRYRFYTNRFLKVFSDYTDRIEKYSIDEAFLDLTLACNIRSYQNGILQKVDPWQEAVRIITEIKRRMITEVGDYITCSAGVSYSKLVAKIASDLQKPNGLVIIRPEDKESLYDRLVLTDVPGIGQRQERNLNKLGIFTLKDLRDYPLSKLVAHFGISGVHLHSMGQLEGTWKESFGDDVIASPIKSIGHMYTIPMEYRQKGVFKSVLYKLSEMVAARLRANSLMGNHVYTYAYNGDDVHVGKGAKIGYYLQDGRELYLEAVNLLDQVTSLSELENHIYSVGVTVGGLVPFIPQASLFEDAERRQRLSLALDKINNKYKDFTIARVPAFLARNIIRDSVGFGRMKEFKTTFMHGG